MDEQRAEGSQIYVTKAFKAYRTKLKLPLRTTIPQAIVRKFDLQHGDRVIWQIEGDHVVIRFKKVRG